MQDTIVREITVKAPAERVYQAITDPTEITKWFPDKVEGSLEVGERPVLAFGIDHKASLYIEAANPSDYFAYRWVPGGRGIIGDVLQVPNTLVEFHIATTDQGTKITLTESGFASLPADVAAESLSQNSGGWDHMMGRLDKYLNQA